MARFNVVQGRVRPHGWVRLNPKNPYRLIFDDGAPFYPVGFQGAFADGNHNGTALDQFCMEGPFLERARGKLPPGRCFRSTPAWGR